MILSDLLVDSSADKLLDSIILLQFGLVGNLSLLELYTLNVLTKYVLKPVKVYIGIVCKGRVGL